ncbi:MAG: GMP synthase [Caldivirga sp.]|jgi:GMP synthase (glutamine-hydrolysing)
MFTPEEFTKAIINEIRGLEIRCAVAAVSGGVDSTTSAVITRLAINDKLIPVLFDTGFMRINEPVEVIESLRGLLPIRLIDVREEFYRAMMGLSDAEEKRVRFRDTFYSALSKLVKDNGCDWLVQGTIAPDWIETVGGIKTQHNVLAQIGIETDRVYGFKLLEPLRELYKDQVRALARFLGVPVSIVDRQPFPGPGLSIRAVGLLTMEKLNVVKWSTKIVEDGLANLGLSQWFAAAWEDERVYDEELSRRVKDLGRGLTVETFKVKGTGVKGDSREYGRIAVVSGELDRWGVVFDLYPRLTYGTDITHVIYEVSNGGVKGGKFFVTIRAVTTSDYMTADVPKLGRDILIKVAEELAKNDSVSSIGFDVTPKPPATIEFE